MITAGLRRGAMALALAGTFGFGGQVATAHGDTAGFTRYANGRPGLATVSNASPSRGSAATASRARGARPIHPLAKSASLSSNGAPVASAAGRAAARLLQNFNGVSSRDSGQANFGLEFEPPDQGLCAGNGFVLEPVNSAYRVYRTNGKTLVGPFNVNDLFNEGAEEFTSDPRCYFDASTNTWFAVILFINSKSTESRFDVAVSRSGDPRGLWAEYQFDTTDNGTHGMPNNPGCPCLGDQPLLGIDQDNLYVSTNEFSLLGPQFNGAQIYAISKADLVATRNTAHFVHFGNLSIGGSVAASVQPALSTALPNAEYFMSSLDPNATFDSRIGVWAMTNRGAVTGGGSPTLTSTVITSEVYGLPPKAVQKGSRSRLDSGDDRMQQVQEIGATLWGELTTAVTIPGDSAERAGAAWFNVRPRLSGDHIGGATVVGQGYVVESGGYVIYPAVQADGLGNAAMVFTLTDSARFPSAAYAALSSAQSQFGQPVVAAAGTGPYDPGATRWGDYSFAVIDPSTDAFWMATEYMPARSSQTRDRLANWGTRVFEVAPGG